MFRYILICFLAYLSVNAEQDVTVEINAIETYSEHFKFDGEGWSALMSQADIEVDINTEDSVLSGYLEKLGDLLTRTEEALRDMNRYMEQANDDLIAMANKSESYGSTIKTALVSVYNLVFGKGIQMLESGIGTAQMAFASGVQQVQSIFTCAKAQFNQFAYKTQECAKAANATEMLDLNIYKNLMNCLPEELERVMNIAFEFKDSIEEVGRFMKQVPEDCNKCMEIIQESQSWTAYWKTTTCFASLLSSDGAQCASLSTKVLTSGYSLGKATATIKTNIELCYTTRAAAIAKKALFYGFDITKCRLNDKDQITHDLMSCFKNITGS